jgi:hypothetical protein
MIYLRPNTCQGSWRSVKSIGTSIYSPSPLTKIPACDEHDRVRARGCRHQRDIGEWKVGEDIIRMREWNTELIYSKGR